MAGVVYEDAIAPLSAVPFFFHWYARVPVPVAATEKIAGCPAVTVWLAGCVAMEIAVVFVLVPLGFPALVRPVQPEIDDAAKRAREMLSDMSGVRLFRDILE